MSDSDDALFFQLFDASPFPAVVTRLRDHVVLAINQRTSDVFGIAQEDAVGEHAPDYYVNPDERRRLAEQVTREGRAENRRFELKRPTGETLWASVSSRRVTFGGEDAILTVFSDITDQVLAERILKASEARLVSQSGALTELTARDAGSSGRFEERLRSILEVSARTLDVERLSLWRIDESRQAIRCVDLHRRTPGSHESGAVLHRAEAGPYFDALERERVIAAADARTDPRTRDFQSDYLAPNGIGAMLDVPLRQDDHMRGVLCAEHVGGARHWTVDEQNFAISTANLIAMALADQERREALARLADSEARARLVVDTAHDAFVGIDTAGTIVTWNAQAEAVFGWSPEEVLGRDMAETIIPPAYREAHHRGMRRFLETGDAPVLNTRLERTALHRTGGEFPIEITITSPIPLAGGYFFGAFIRDITARREQEAQLRAAKESAEAATRAKSDFLASMSHELRTPLNGVLGYTQLLQRDRTLNATQRDALEAIARCGAHLLDLINDVLDLSRIEAGRIDIEPTSTNLAQLIIDLKYVVAEAARRKGLLLTMTIAPDVPQRVCLDGRHLRQVLLNLLGNALKFTHQGEVRLAIEVVDDRQLCFEVSDTGVGIEPEALTGIFDAFTQTRAGAAAGGTGLGLTISRHLIQTMGDDLRVESTPGEGSRFFFALPLVAAGEGAGPPADEPLDPPLDARLAPGEDLTALVVDDSTVNRRILARLLESAGVRVITAAGGDEVLRLARAHAPDVILMDLRMGGLDGLETTRRLKQDASVASIPVIAVTASAFGDTRQAARDAGCTDYLSKPVRAESLYAALREHLGVRFIVTPAPEPPREPELSDHSRRVDLARRLHEAASIGSVTDIEALAQELVAGDDGEAALGQRIARLNAQFDFEGLADLAHRLLGRSEGAR
ncbi:MAG: PAS domain S-box protein [Acidobacteria bacterium]|nr:PAS domain S-box protein [Acidobacteriota bacterium]